jgi:hypothetical protein
LGYSAEPHPFPLLQVSATPSLKLLTCVKDMHS